MQKGGSTSSSEVFSASLWRVWLIVGALAVDRWTDGGWPDGGMWRQTVSQRRWNRLCDIFKRLFLKQILLELVSVIYSSFFSYLSVCPFLHPSINTYMYPSTHHPSIYPLTLGPSIDLCLKHFSSPLSRPDFSAPWSHLSTFMTLPHFISSAAFMFLIVCVFNIFMCKCEYMSIDVSVDLLVAAQANFVVCTNRIMTINL